MTAYYNELDPKAAAWLRELIKQGHIAKGEVDERSILEVQPDDLRGFTQCHFFAGIGVWSYALRLAGWPDNRPVWTGSCPCQPFSAAGKGDEFADERHLWPAWFGLARKLRPDAIFGEQVSSKDALAWFDHVRVDLEGEGYAVGVLDTCAAGVGAPHIRQRLYFVAQSNNAERRTNGARGYNSRGHDAGRSQGTGDVEGCRAVGNMGNPSGRGLGIERDEAQQGSGRHADGAEQLGRLENSDSLLREQPSRERPGPGEADRGRSRGQSAGPGAAGGRMADTASRNPGEERQQRSGIDGLRAQGGRDHGQAGGDQRPGHPNPVANTQHQGPSRPGGEPQRESPEQQFGDGGGEKGPTNGFWSNAEWIPCRDGKARPTEPGTFPLVTGAPARVVRLRGYGNAINAEQARNFIESYIEVRVGL